MTSIHDSATTETAALRVAMLSMHTSPLAQPGDGDAGGMNVYIANVSRALADAGVHVDCYTLDTSGEQGTSDTADAVSIRSVELNGCSVHTVHLPEVVGAIKEQLPAHIEAWADAIRDHVSGADVIHSHYWLSGIAGLHLAKDLGIPLVHTMHTIGEVKNEHSAADAPIEPQVRIDAESRLGAEAARLTANTVDELADLTRFCGAAESRIAIVTPGVDDRVFNPGARNGARQNFEFSDDDFVATFVGRLQRHKGPNVAIAAVATFLDREPAMRARTRLIICGGASGLAGFSRDDLQSMAEAQGIGSNTSFVDPLPPIELTRLYAASDVLLMPSVTESFGLVAMEAQACGTPVIATANGGLLATVVDGTTGLLVASRDAATWADAIKHIADLNARRSMSTAAAAHASQFTWQRTAEQLLEVYRAVRV